MTLGLLKACSKGLVLKVMFIQYSVGERYTYDRTWRTQEDEMKEDVRFLLQLILGKMQTLSNGLTTASHNSMTSKGLQIKHLDSFFFFLKKATDPVYFTDNSAASRFFNMPTLRLGFQMNLQTKTALVHLSAGLG